MKLESAQGDMSGWREMDFALNCTYIVPDQVSDPSFSLPKAMTSIPRNLTFEYSTDNEVRTPRVFHSVYLLRYSMAYLENVFLNEIQMQTQVNFINWQPSSPLMLKHVSFYLINNNNFKPTLSWLQSLMLCLNRQFCLIKALVFTLPNIKSLLHNILLSHLYWVTWNKRSAD